MAGHGMLRSHARRMTYEDLWRSSHPDASTESGGRVVVRFVIDRRGGVPSVSLGASELHAPQLGCCVVKRVAQWTFPRPRDASFVVVEYPFVVHLAR